MHDVFQPFSLTHAIALVTIAALTSLLVVHARGLRAEARSRFERRLAIANAAVWLIVRVWWMLPPRFDLATSLPLHLCPIMVLLASVVLISPQRWLRALLYFWGIGLCTQALMTPNLEEPPSSIWFWTFWFQHGVVIAIAVYDLAVRSYRPKWRDYGIACVAGLVYVGIVLPIDIALHSDYGFVGEPTPKNPSILDYLGPWPQRVVTMVLLAAAVMAAMMLPWARRRDGTPPSSQRSS